MRCPIKKEGGERKKLEHGEREKAAVSTLAHARNNGETTGRRSVFRGNKSLRVPPRERRVCCGRIITIQFPITSTYLTKFVKKVRVLNPGMRTVRRDKRESVRPVYIHIIFFQVVFSRFPNH